MVQRRTRGASGPSSTSGVQTPEPAACQSGLAWARRPRRLTPLPWLSPQGLRERALARCAWRRAHRGVECRGLCDGLAELGVAACAQAMPSSCPSLGRAPWREEAQYDVRELLLHGGHRALAGVDAGRVPEKDPRLFFFAQVQHVVQCGCELQERGRDGPAVP